MCAIAFIVCNCVKLYSYVCMCLHVWVCVHMHAFFAHMCDMCTTACICVQLCANEVSRFERAIEQSGWEHMIVGYWCPDKYKKKIPIGLYARMSDCVQCVPLCVYVCICVSMCAYVCICMQMCVDVCNCLHMCAIVCICVRACVYVCNFRAYVCACVQVRACV
jgi:hypothetical protein